ncbi:unnamed protein product [Pieris brassicae]|uniref:Uncharacterized protein n=1 Tax=Pieris brassicae TaxID=7116 RepID=A0A9P0TN22_PIEBR|nr:unnamed protein product [Pieris brassicae]
MSSGENDDSLKVKCLNDSVRWNEIPSCSNINVIPNDFIVINVTCDVEKPERTVGTNISDCDNSSILSVENSIVPVGNNELVQSDSQKLVSLSLSILLAAILQAMRCFAQFLEDIVGPQRL